jgi:hypothetical protein
MEKVVAYYNLSMGKSCLIAEEEKLRNDKKGGDWPRPDQWEAAVQSPCLKKKNRIMYCTKLIKLTKEERFLSFLLYNKP